MRSLFSTAVLAATLATLHACVQPQTSAPPAPAKIVFDNAAYDFGTIEQGTTVQHTYAFKNAGGLDLNVDNVRTSCGCTATVSATHSLTPGTTSGIEVACDTANVVGSQSRTLTVYSNDPAQPVSTLTLTGRVRADIAADPPHLYLGHLRRGQAARSDVRLLGEVDAGSVEVSGKSVDATLENNNGAGKRLHVAIKPNAPLGPFAATVTVHTHSQRQPLLHVPITGFVDGNVLVSPAELNFGTTTPSAKASRVLGVQQRGTQALHVSAVHLAPEIGSAAVTPVRAGDEYRVTVTLNDGLHPGKISGTLEIETDDPEQPRIQVPCVGRVAERS